MPFVALALIATLALGGGLSVAAENAHQGDALYSYKTTVNDNVEAGAEATANEVAHVGTSLQSALHFGSSTKPSVSHEGDEQGDDTSSSTSVNAEASTSVHGQLHVRGDDEDDVEHEGSEDGSVHVNIF